MPKPNYLSEVHRDATAFSAGWTIFDSGAEAIEIVFDIEEPMPNTGEKTLVGSLWMTDKAIERSRKTLIAVGVDPADPTLETDEDLAKAVIGKRFKLVCGLEAPNEYHKNEKWVVRFINGPKRELAPGSKVGLARLRGQAAPAASEDGDVPW